MTHWRQQVLELAKGYRHPGWGQAHGQRVYGSATWIAASLGGGDDDVLFAAAYLHDLGALVPWRQTGVDHAERSVEVVPGILGPTDFPGGKLPAVQRAIRTHMYSSTPDNSVEAVAIRDADILDFLGAIGVARLISTVGLSDWTPDLPTALSVIKGLNTELPGLVRTTAARPLAIKRAAEAAAFIGDLAGATERLTVL